MDLSHLPQEPGVYLYKDKKGTIIYVGKAKKLKTRVRSYFQKNHQSPKTRFLVQKIAKIDFIVVSSEVEALLLENKLIKQHQPKYNIMLKDGKTYAHIVLTNEAYPRVYSTRRINKKDTFFGPYTDGSARRQIVQLANDLFQLRTCRTLPKRACLQYHLNLCTAPCINKVSKEAYNKQVAQAKEFLKGNTQPIAQQLEKDMQEAARNQKYEVALEKKRYLESLHLLQQRQAVEQVRDYDQDVIAVSEREKQASIVVFSVTKGVISGKKVFSFEKEAGLLDKFIGLYYESNVPAREILLSQACEQTELLEKYLSHKRNGAVRLLVPQRGDKHKLVSIALRNAQLQVDQTVLKELQQKLNLPQVPYTVECFDISNLKDKHIVGGMTQWVGGLEHKAGHRRFLVKSISSQDDFAAMHEVVYRRYKNLYELPDLILIDGGKGQLGAALQALKKAGVHVPIISLAKQDEEIYLPGEDESRKYPHNSPMMLLLRAMRDSVHRYVLAYNKKRRSMELENN